MRDLPANWEPIKLGHIIELVYGKGLTKKERNRHGKYPVYGSNGVVDYHDEFLVKGPVIVVGRKGAAGLPTYCSDSCWPIDTTYYIMERSAYELKFIYYLLLSLRLEQFDRSTAIPGLNRDDAYALNVGLPPFDEQRRIVAKIEELFSELDKGIESLKTAREQLKVYRQAVFKQAFEGKLTSQWREENKDKLESSDQLLARIKQQREARYQQQLADWKAAVNSWEMKGKKSKRPVKPRRQNDATPPTEEELVGFPDLPAEWKWVKVGELVWSVRDGPHYSPKYAESGIPFITGGNVRPGGIDFESAKFITPDLHQELSARCKPEKGDVLYTKGGTTGIARVNTYDFEFNVWVHVAVLKITDSLEPFYLQHALNSPKCYAQSQKYTHGVGNQDLGLTRMVNIILPLCGKHEQAQIIEIIDRLTSVFDEIDETIRRELAKSQVLRQSILEKAFSGQLVAQDPNDEPASVLLQRSKDEKEEQANGKKSNKRKNAA